MRASLSWAVAATFAAAMIMLSGCGEHGAQSAAPTSPGSQAGATAAENSQLQRENQQLRSEVDALKKQVEDLKQTPKILLDRVSEAAKAEDVAAARDGLGKLENRFGSVQQTIAARQLVAALETRQREREQEAKRIEAQGFYAIKTTGSVALAEIIVKVESVRLGSRWVFDSYSDSFFYRDSERGSQFILLNVLIQSEDKNPDLPDLAVYEIDGKVMRHISDFRYEFRRWSSHGTYIGLYHDFKNDFAHAKSIPFNAAAVIEDAQAKKPLAIVASGRLCHERGEKIGNPEVTYRRKICDTKSPLDVTDFSGGSHRVVAYINRPR